MQGAWPGLKSSAWTVRPVTMVPEMEPPGEVVSVQVWHCDHSMSINS